ncbi:DUF2894 domain-containing protein [Pseudorhodoferax sp.]|uniref:DUF2894 domain-containing protein n=1 Tax=Pseudorhodoferax sp. TaxID=1993553 RepID=UPI0039E28F0B
MDSTAAVGAPGALRQHAIDALERRAARHQGAAHALLQARLQALRAQALPAPPPPPPARPAGPGPLAALLQALGPPPAHDPGLLQYFRSTWARLDAEARLARSLADAPENPGPLNSRHLVQQALQLMRAEAPDYLRHFMAQVDALMWLEQAQAEAAQPAREGRKAAGKAPAKSGGRRAGRSARS